LCWKSTRASPTWTRESVDTRIESRESHRPKSLFVRAVSGSKTSRTEACKSVSNQNRNRHVGLMKKHARTEKPTTGTPQKKVPWAPIFRYLARAPSIIMQTTRYCVIRSHEVTVWHWSRTFVTAGITSSPAVHTLCNTRAPTYNYCVRRTCRTVDKTSHWSFLIFFLSFQPSTFRYSFTAFAVFFVCSA